LLNHKVNKLKKTAVRYRKSKLTSRHTYQH